MEPAPDTPRLIDCEYLRPGLAGAWLLRAGDRAAFAECNTSLAVPRLLAALGDEGLGPEAVEWVFASHVHLDHAGGAGALLRALPKAKLVVHPKGARHMADPSRLIAGATAVYGAEHMAALYGEIAPVPGERIAAPDDGQEIRLGERRFTVLHTPGHAAHHLALHDPELRGVFTGDVFGLAYPALATPQGAFLFPSTAPSQLDPEAMRASIARIAGLAPAWLWLTHFGALPCEPRLAEELSTLLGTWTGLARAACQHHADPGAALAALRRQLHFSLWSRYARACGAGADEVLFNAWMDLDLDLNAQGLLHWARAQGA